MTPLRETKSQLSRRLKLHRHQLDAFLSRPGAPNPDRRKTYSVREVADFVSSQRDGGALDTLRAARLYEVQLRCEKLRRELALQAKEVMTVREVNEALCELGRTLRLNLYSGAENNLPPLLDGLPAVEVRRLLIEWADSFLTAARDTKFGNLAFQKATGQLTDES